MDTLAEPAPSPPGVAAPRRRSVSVLIAVIVFHLVFVGIATVWVVSQYNAGRKLTFNAGPKSPNPSERALEHRVQLQKKKESVSAPPAVPKRVLTTGAARLSLPPIPEIKTEAMPQTMMGAAGNAAAFGTGAAASLGGGGGNGTAINFFGIRDISTSIVIMIDISDSMFGRTGDYDYKSHKPVRQGTEQNFQMVRDEAIKLVQSLTPATRFGIVRWSGGAYSWKPELVAATEENKAAAIEHIQKEIDLHKAPRKPGTSGGTRHDYALQEAFKLQPETIYMLTDGNATGVTPEEIYKIVDNGQKTLPKKLRLHVIYYLTGKDNPKEREFMQRLAARTGGKFRSVEAKGRKQ